MFADKSVLEERQPAYLGIYDGRLMDESVRAFVESCDWVLSIGAMMTDFNTGAFTARLDPRKTIDIRHHRTQVGATVYPNVEMKDLLAELTRRIARRDGATSVQPISPGPAVGSGDDPITAEALYPRWANFLKPNDIVIAETGTSSMGLAFALMPPGATFHNQTLWGSIGWATPAAFGAAVAAPTRRVVLVTGEGSHQLTVQEISQFGRRGLRPIVFVLNNSGYLIERLLCSRPDIASTTSPPGVTPRFRTPWAATAGSAPGRHLRRIGPGVASRGARQYGRLHRSCHRRLRRFAAFREAARECEEALPPVVRGHAGAVLRFCAAPRAQLLGQGEETVSPQGLTSGFSASHWRRSVHNRRFCS